jgi:enamine deaminase RidA (YjgF/YER057c/UK114 family)
MTSVDDRLKAAGITLPEAAAAVANYVPYLQTGKLVYISGQLPLKDGKLAFTGKVGKDITPEDAATAARYCAINLVAQVKAALGGDLDRVARVVKLSAFIACADDFTGQPQVANGASDLMVEVFGDKGRHTRAAVGTNVLPMNAPVEIEAVFEVE